MTEPGLRKLVIAADDQDGPRYMLDRFLRDQGYEAQVVHDPSAITDLGECMAVIMDIAFGPGRFLGRDWVVEKRQSGELGKDTLVIFITNYSTRPPDLERAGRHEIMYKPIEFTRLRKLLAAEAHP